MKKGYFSQERVCSILLFKYLLFLVSKFLSLLSKIILPIKNYPAHPSYREYPDKKIHPIRGVQNLKKRLS